MSLALYLASLWLAFLLGRQVAPPAPNVPHRIGTDEATALRVGWGWVPAVHTDNGLRVVHYQMCGLESPHWAYQFPGLYRMFGRRRAVNRARAYLELQEDLR